MRLGVILSNLGPMATPGDSAWLARRAEEVGLRRHLPQGPSGYPIKSGIQIPLLAQWCPFGQGPARVGDGDRAQLTWRPPPKAFSWDSASRVLAYRWISINIRPNPDCRVAWTNGPSVSLHDVLETRVINDSSHFDDCSGGCLGRDCQWLKLGITRGSRGHR